MKITAAKFHLSLNVSDIEKSVAWYETLFGEPVHKRRPGYANFDLEKPPLKLALQQNHSHGEGALNHLGILVSDLTEVRLAKERLEKAGLVTFSEENVTCCYAKQDKIWVRDPDGNAWEIYALLDDMMEQDDDHDHEQSCCQANPNETACCKEQIESCC